MMTAAEIIREIKQLPPDDRLRVAQFVTTELNSPNELSGTELASLAERMLAAREPADKAAMKARIVAGFYGESSDA